MPRATYDDDQACDALFEIADKLKEVDKLFYDAWDRFPKAIKDLIEEHDPKNDLDVDHWSKQFAKVAEAVAGEIVAKQREVALSNPEPASSTTVDYDSPRP